MKIVWLGLSAFRLQNKESTIIIDPLSDKAFQEKVDIFLISSPHLFSPPAKNLSSHPWIIQTPGEYEIKNTNITVTSALGANQKPTNIFFIEREGIKLLHLGTLKDKKSVVKILDKINGIDLLMIPVGGQSVLSAGDAAALVNQIEPLIVIPMLYQDPSAPTLPSLKLDPLENFVKEIGQESQQFKDLTLNKKPPVPEEKTKLILLKPCSL